METGHNKQNFRVESGRKETVAGQNLVTIVPPVRILDRVGLHVPVVVLGVPIRVHGRDTKYAICHLCHHPSKFI